VAAPGSALVLALVLAAFSQATHGRTSAKARKGSSSRSSTTLVTPTSSPAAGSPDHEGVPSFSHVFVVMMENLSETEALATAPILALVERYASATSYYAVSHPSLPNYLALVSGSTWGVTSDCTSCHVSGPSLATQLQSAHITWAAYFENMPGACFTGPQSPDGLYAQKHDPFIYFDQVRTVPGLCDHLQPLTSLTGLLGQSSSSVPRFVWVTPDMCDDGHNCPASQAGQWLTGFVASVTSSAAWRDGGVLFVTWDEGTDDSGVDIATGDVVASGGGGNVLTLVVAPGLPTGERVTLAYNHYSMLRTIEDAFGLPLLGGAGGPGIHPMSAFWSKGSQSSSDGT